MKALRLTHTDDTATLAGDFDGRAAAPLQALVAWAKAPGKKTIDLAGVRAINSEGAGAWLRAMRGFDPARTVLTRLSADFVDTANMLDNFVGKLPVASFHAALRCDKCGEDAEALLPAAAPAPSPCARCGGARAFVLDPDECLRFLAKTAP